MIRSAVKKLFLYFYFICFFGKAKKMQSCTFHSLQQQQHSMSSEMRVKSPRLQRSFNVALHVDRRTSVNASKKV